MDTERLVITLMPEIINIFKEGATWAKTQKPITDNVSEKSQIIYLTKTQNISKGRENLHAEKYVMTITKCLLCLQYPKDSFNNHLKNG